MRLVLLRQHVSLFFFNDTATTEIYTLSLHDALPISHYALPPVTPFDKLDVLASASVQQGCCDGRTQCILPASSSLSKDRKSTRLNSSHVEISYAVFCLKKKKKKKKSFRAITPSTTHC